MEEAIRQLKDKDAKQASKDRNQLNALYNCQSKINEQPREAPPYDHEHSPLEAEVGRLRRQDSDKSYRVATSALTGETKEKWEQLRQEHGTPFECETQQGKQAYTQVIAEGTLKKAHERNNRKLPYAEDWQQIQEVDKADRVWKKGQHQLQPRTRSPVEDEGEGRA
ncbi:hypothetical protein BDV96DRAFT_652734 [Lophiotrema nucula]|uniref:Uncharacterized protein n=1 Tax=Lophiotrema nucula TaxID=690887 RepID=A0A6A5YMX9_9PLEO|nr:hypothetical protein BDV96DRAFT_652734 [Lophiotrema nucula]